MRLEAAWLDGLCERNGYRDRGSVESLALQRCVAGPRLPACPHPPITPDAAASPPRSQGIESLDDALRDYRSLRSLDLSHNDLTSLRGLQGLPCLAYLNVAANQLASLDDMVPLSEIPSLEELDARFNPVASNALYRQCVPAPAPPPRRPRPRAA